MRLAKSKTTGKPFASSPEDRAERRARAALAIAVAEAAMDAERARIEKYQASNDNNPRWRGTLPVLNAIRAKDPEGAHVVRAWGRSAEDQVFGDEDRTEIDAIGDRVKLKVERLHDIRPSINQILADLLRVRAVSVRAEGGWRLTQRVDGMATRPVFENDWTARLAGMTFNYHPRASRPPAGGLMTGYTDANGAEWQPFYDTSAKRGFNGSGDRPSKPGVKRPVCLPLEVDRLDVSESAADIFEMILAGYHWYQIGEALGYSRPYADRGAKARVWAAVTEAKAMCRAADNCNRGRIQQAA